MGKKRKRGDLCVECRKSKRPAIMAARLGHEDCLITAYRVLGVFNERDDYGATPIHFAARNGRLDCLEWLVKHSGVSPNALAFNGASAAHDAAAMGHTHCLRFLLTKTHCSEQDITVEGATVLHMACRFGQVETVRWLLERTDISPGVKGANDVTPIHLCAAKNHLDCLHLLTQHPEYVPNQRTVHGATPTYFAAQEGSVQCLDWLVRCAGGDPLVMAADGMGPIHAAAQAGQLRCLAWLVKKGGISSRCKARDGATPAHFAAASGQVECLEWILNHGGSVMDKDNLGGTPLHDAAEQGQVGSVSVLLRYGVNAHSEDYDGLKPIDLARDNKHEECVKILFKVITPTILTSLTPRHSLSRASQCSDEHDEKQHRLAKQAHFEETLLSGISEERREAIWQSAQAGSVPQPGLNLIMKGEVLPSVSQLSVTQPKSATSSARHSLRSNRQDSLNLHRNSLGSDLLKDQPTKVRPALSPTLFNPNGAESGDDPFSKQLKHTALMEKLQEIYNETETMENGDESFGHAEEFAQGYMGGEKADFLKRLKFKKKFMSGSKPGKKIKAKKSQSDADPRQANIVPPVQHSLVAASDQSSKFTTSQKEAPQQENMALPVTQNHLHFPSEKNQKMLAIPMTVNGATLESTELRQQSKTEAGAVKSEVILRKKKKANSLDHPVSHGEEAVITHKRNSPGLITPFEEVAISFQTKSSIVKKAFPVTHQQLLTEEDLSSPEASDEESEAEEDQEIGFESMDMGKFEQFGNPLISSLPKDSRRRSLEAEQALQLKQSVKTKLDIKAANFQEGNEVDAKNQRDSSSEASDDTLVVQEEEESQLPLAVSLKEGQQQPPSQIQQPSSSGTVDEERVDSVAELREIADSAGVQKRLSLFQRKEHKLADGPFQVGSRQPIELGMLKRGGVSARLKMFEDLEDGIEPQHPIPPRVLPNPTKLSTMIVEEEEENDDDKEENEDGEMKDAIAPLPHIHAKEKRKYEEKQKMDGLSPEITRRGHPPTSSHTAKQKSKLSPLTSMVASFDQPIQATPRKKEKKTVFSPLSTSTSANSMTTTSSLATKNHLKETAKKEENTAVTMQKSSCRLLQKPILSGDSVPSVFQKLDLSPGALRVWQLKGKNLRCLQPQNGVIFSTTGTYVLLEVHVTGPLLYHVYQWDGSQAAHRDRELGYKWCDLLCQCLPGIPVLHSMRQGFESAEFSDQFQSLLNRTENFDVPLNKANTKAVLYRYSNSGFEKVESNPPSRKDFGSDAVIMDTQTRLFLWLPAGSLQRLQQPTLALVQKYLLFQNFHHNVPVMVVSEDGEPFEFTSHFFSWPYADITSVEGIEELRLPSLTPPSPQLSASGCVKVWSVDGNRRLQVAIDLIGQFFSDQTYLVEHNSKWQKELFTWIGEDVSNKNTNLQNAINLCASKDNAVYPVMVVIPQGKETDEFLKLFKGKFINHKTKLVTNPVHMYKVSGSGALQMKTQEVYPRANELNSNHCLLLKTPFKLFVWSGKSSSVLERRASQLITKQLGKDKKTITVSEGMESPDFWAVLGSKEDYQHADPVELFPITEPRVYFCSLSQEGKPQFHRKLRWNEKDLTKRCLLIHWKDKLIVWVGAAFQLHFVSSVSLVEAFIMQYISWKTLENFITIFSHEGIEGETVKKLLSFVNSSVTEEFFFVHVEGEETEEESGEEVSEEQLIPVDQSNKQQYPQDSEKENVPAADTQTEMVPKEATNSRDEAAISVTMGMAEEEESFTEIDHESLKHSVTREGLVKAVSDGCNVQKESRQGDEQTTEAIQPIESQADKDEATDVVYRQSSSSNPLTLTRSQEIAFNNIEWLQGALEANIKSSNNHLTENQDLTPKNRSSALRTTATVQQLSDMIDALDSLIHPREPHAMVQPVPQPISSGGSVPPPIPVDEPLQQPAASYHQEQTDRVAASPATKNEGRLVLHPQEPHAMVQPVPQPISSGRSVPPPTPVDEPLQQPVASYHQEQTDRVAASPVTKATFFQPSQSSKANEGRKKVKVKDQKMICVDVQVEEGRRTVRVQVREDAPVITVIFRTSDQVGLVVTVQSALFEVSGHLKIERVLEDHELIQDIMKSWPKKHPPHLVLKPYQYKYSLWISSPLPKSAVSQFLKENKVPDISSQLQYCKNPSKGHWTEGTFCLGSLGIYLVSQRKHTSKLDLVAGLDDYLYYFPESGMGYKKHFPSAFCFVMKPMDLWKEKDSMYFCVPDFNTYLQWILAIRLVKYGLQLKGNYIAMRNRLQKREALQ